MYALRRTRQSRWAGSATRWAGGAEESVRGGEERREEEGGEGDVGIQRRVPYLYTYFGRPCSARRENINAHNLNKTHFVAFSNHRMRRSTVHACNSAHTPQHPHLTGPGRRCNTGALPNTITRKNTRKRWKYRQSRAGIPPGEPTPSLQRGRCASKMCACMTPEI